jgi:hypothetical protein
MAQLVALGLVALAALLGGVVGWVREHEDDERPGEVTEIDDARSKA